MRCGPSLKTMKFCMQNSYAYNVFPVIKLINVFYDLLCVCLHCLPSYIVWLIHCSSKKVKILTILLYFTILSWCFCFVCPHIAHFHNRSNTVVYWRRTLAC